MEMGIFYGTNKVYFSSNAGVWEQNGVVSPKEYFAYPLVQKESYSSEDLINLSSYTNVEKDKIVSLRGTLVPASTINKAIGSIPLLGKILVGSKVGEGVFGVSFKIKGPPKDLQTTVNPIKTLTPRFITRTLEKIKKN